MYHRIEVLEPATEYPGQPEPHHEPHPGSNGNSNGQRKPCGGCGGGGRHHQHQVRESAAPEAQGEAPPPYLTGLYNRYHLVGWMEENLLKTHQAVRESADAAHASLVIRSSLEAFLDVLEDVMFRCDDLAKQEGTDERARCPIARVWDELETKLVFYGKELRFLGTMAGVSDGA